MMTLDILIPSYQGERYLPLCLTALAQSTHRNFRVYVSVEGGLKNLDFVRELGESLRLAVEIVVDNERIGLASNRRKLLATGDAALMLWLDDDVLVAEDSLARLVAAAQCLGKDCCMITGVASNFHGYPRVACGLGLTLSARRFWLGDEALDHDFGFNTGEDWLWTSRVVFKTGLPVRFVPVVNHHIGEHRRRKRYARQWDPSMFSRYTSPEFYQQNRDELDLSSPVYNYLDY